MQQVNELNEHNRADDLLVKNVLGGNTNAFASIITATERLVTKIVFKMIPGSEDRRDIAQDIYLKVFQNLGSFKFQSKLSTWVAQIAYNTCLTHLEKKKHIFLKEYYPVTDNDTDDEHRNGFVHFAGTVKDAETIYSANERMHILQQGINRLSPVYKTIISLYHQHEMSYAEIAQITQLPEGTVKSYLFRARKELKDQLLKTYKKEEL
jgi:RNA polymerase sigma factor (sigma-70 family)